MIVAKTLTGDPCVRKGGGGRCTRHRCSRSCCKCARASDGLRGSQTRGVAVFRASPLDLSGLRVVNLCAGFWDAMPLAQCGKGGGGRRRQGSAGTRGMRVTCRVSEGETCASGCGVLGMALRQRKGKVLKAAM